MTTTTTPTTVPSDDPLLPRLRELEDLPSIAAVDALAAGQWDRAKMLFEQVSAEDAPSRFFLDVISEHQGVAPADWTGAIELRSK